MKPLLPCFFVFACFTLNVCRAEVVWDESELGDLSDDGSAPTEIDFMLGENEIRGRMGFIDAAVDSDVFRFTVPNGLTLTSFRMENYTETPDIEGGSFLAIASGSSISTVLGSTHLSNALIGQAGEWLDDLAAGARYGSPAANVQGLTAPVPPGDYVIWFQETSTQIDYTMIATLAVPEPPTASIAAMAGIVWLSLTFFAWYRSKNSS